MISASFLGLVMFFQVHQLYETTQRWSPIASALPELVQRLVTIKQLHEQGVRLLPRHGVLCVPHSAVASALSRAPLRFSYSYAVWSAPDTLGHHSADDRQFPEGQRHSADPGVPIFCSIEDLRGSPALPQRALF